MDNEFNKLYQNWQQHKEEIENNPKVMTDMLSIINAKKTSTVHFHYGNIIVLLIVMLGVASFFYFMAPVKELISRIGVGLMIGGLLIRIIIELTSVVKSKKVNVVNNVLQATQDTIVFYNFRKKIHRPVTIIILLLYTIGFYMITPEFSLYFTTWQMILIDVSYLVGAAIFIPIIRRSIKKELKTLQEIIEFKKKMLESNS